MIFNNKGWLSQYLKFLENFGKNNQNNPMFDPYLFKVEADSQFYRFIQPTGILYGHPIQSAIQYGTTFESLDVQTKMKILFIDSFHNYQLLQKKIDDPIHSADFFNENLDHIIRYYEEFFPGIKTGSRSMFGVKRNKERVLERIIDKRVEIKSGMGNNFWASFFHNSLLFLDIYYFRNWSEIEKGILNPSDFEQRSEDLRLNLLKTIAIAAHSNGIIELEEKQLFDIFLYSARLSRHNKEKAKKYLLVQPGINDLEVDGHPWLLKKYFLEMAILTVWADRTVEEKEEDFLKLLTHKLGFTESEFQDSMMAIESFVLGHWQEIHYLQKRHDYSIVRDQLLRNIKQNVLRNKDALAKEMYESKELMSLLLKSQKEKLSDVEKEKVKTQLLDILKTLPTFVIIALPGTFITLPLMLKLLPSSAFPTAFREKDLLS